MNDSCCLDLCFIVDPIAAEDSGSNDAIDCFSSFFLQNVL